MTLLITSHILQEIEHLADTIGVMNEGRLNKKRARWKIIFWPSFKEEAQMLKLINLEYKKTKLTNVCLISMIAIVALIFWCVWSKSGHPKCYINYQDAFAEISYYTNMVSQIISVILIIKIVHDEFRRKTISVFFTYPHSRAKLFAAKLIFISLLPNTIFWKSNLIVSSVFLLFSSSIQPNLEIPPTNSSS